MPLPQIKSPTLRRSISLVLLLFTASLFAADPLGFFSGSARESQRVPVRKSADSDQRHEIVGVYGQLPLSFEKNQGQFNRRVGFKARGLNYALFLSANEAVFALRSDKKGESSDGVEVLRMKLLGARRNASVSGSGELPGKVNYFIGNDSRKWRKNIPTYSEVRCRNVYDGIDLIYHGNQQQLEYDFVIAPGASPRRIKMAFTGANKIAIDGEGNLILSTGAGDVRQQKPFAYQSINGERREVRVKYKLQGKQVGFQTGSYDRDYPLTIDPVLIYSTYLGGSSSEQGLAIAVDAAGSAYLAGNTFSTDFPLAGAFQNVKGDAFSTDAFVVKLNPAGNALSYATYLGGVSEDNGTAIAVDAQGSAYVVGGTVAANFPTTAGVVQNTKDGSADVFITKLSPDGSSLSYSTLLGGDNADVAFGVALDTSGRAYVVGRTDSTRFLTFTFPSPRNGSPIYKSTNNAGLWSPISTGFTASTVLGLTIDPSNSNTLYAATNYGVFKTIDAGGNWSFTGASSPANAQFTANAVAVDPSNSSNVYVATFNGVYKSTDGGASYLLKGSPFVSTSFAIAIDPSTPITVYAGTLSNPWKSTNGGDTWVQINSGISSTARVNDFVFDPTNSSTLYIATNRGIYKTTNGGTSWSALNPNFSFSNFNSVAIDPLNPQILYAGGSSSAGPLHKSTDGGATWVLSSNGLSYTFGGVTFPPSINSIAVDPVTPSTIYVAANNGAVFKSTDSGANWSPSRTNFPNFSASDVVVDRNNPAIVYASTTIGSDVFATRLNSAGSAIDYFLNFGGHENDEARGVAVDTDNTAYVVGTTTSENFPVLGAFQSASGGPPDVFVSKLDANGSSLVYSTYLGGNSTDQGRSIAVRNGSAYVVGQTTSTNFPLLNSLKPAPTNFDADAVVAKLNSSGSSLDFSTCLGGASNDGGFGLALDSTGMIYVTGSTSSDDFPVVDATQQTRGGGTDAFVTKLNGAVPALLYSTYLGGTGQDQGNGIAVDAAGNALIIGTTSSSNFPTASPLDTTLGGSGDAFVTKLGTSADLSISKSDSRDPVMVNNPLSYTLQVTNNGPSPSSSVTATDVLPAGLTFGSANSTQGSCTFNSGTVTCNLGNLAVAASATITIAVTPTSVTTISNTATVTGDEPDDIPGNNSDTEATKIAALPSINGRVRDGGSNGVSGVLMTLSGSQSATTQTDASGFYQFAELPAGGNYTITPSKAEFSFDPEAQTFNSLNADQTADFLATTCTYSIAPTSQSFGAAGGTGTINVTTLHGCSWTAVSSDPWIIINSGSSGTGNGVVGFTVNVANAPRAGHITVAGKNFPIYQEFNSCGAPSFSVANYNLGNFSTVVRVADLNGDGRQDLVAANGGGLSAGGGIEVAVLMNSPSEVFAPSKFNTNLGGLTGIVVAEFNNDNRPDIAVANFNSLFVRIFYNNGSGGFGPSVDYPITSQPDRGLFATDFNRDGKMDLVVSAFNSSIAQVLLSNGSGGFTQTNLTIGTSFTVIATSDLNNDGNPDLLLGGSSSSQPMAVHLGNGSGGFGAAIPSTGFGAIGTPAIGDFDGDGLVDIAAGGGIFTAPFTIAPALVVLTGDGAGHFALKSSFSTDHTSGLTAADINNDGKLDVAFTRGENVVTTLLGDGLGGLGSVQSITTVSDNFGSGNFGIVAGDLLGDAKPDLAVANYNYASSILRNTCAAAPSISGRITDTRTFNGIAGVDITLGPVQAINTTTDSNGNYFIGNLTAGADYDVIPSKANFKFNPSSIHISNLTGSQVANFVGTPTTVHFTQIHYLVDEFTPSVQINVGRSGDLSGITTVEYSTVNGTASDRSDFTAAAGTLRFASGEAVKSFNVLLTNDVLIEGFESLRLKLSNPTGAILTTTMTDPLPSDVLMEIRDNDFNPSALNPIGDSVFFVRQHYHDFLNREPDAGGLSFWVDQIDSCATDVGCREVRRINVSAAFFLSIEFQETGYFAYRVYNAAYGDTTSPNVPGTVPIIRLQEFLPASQQIGFGIQVGIGDWQQKLEENKNAYVLGFVQTARFIAAYPLSMTADQFVTKLDQNAGGVLSADEQAQLVALLAVAPADATKRASVLRSVAEDADLRQRELNRAFVLMQFYGYLRRNPDDPQDTDFRGWKFWLDKLNQFNGNFVEAEMVKSFLVSGEYRQRFGTP